MKVGRVLTRSTGGGGGGSGFLRGAFGLGATFGFGDGFLVGFLAGARLEGFWDALDGFRLAGAFARRVVLRRCRFRRLGTGSRPGP